jgi:TAG lipase/lysophosphatidylethanolamine acyltransferase
MQLIFESGGIDLKAFSTKTSKGNISRKIARFMKHGYLLDVKVLEDCVKSNLGDITFEEAYKKTKRVLNITVLSSKKHMVPRVLNYLTAPNVLIRSAATSSAASNVLFSSVDLLAKDNVGNIYKWFPAYFKDTTSASTDESPETRVAQLFNVNFIIISEATPYIVPFLNTQTSKSKFKDKIITFVSSEIRYRAAQLSKLNLLPSFLSSLFDYHTSNITVAPKLSSDDFYTIFSNPTFASLSYWILKGERSVWPLLNLIKQNTRVEIKLQHLLLRMSVKKNTNDVYDDLRKRGNSIG